MDLSVTEENTLADIAKLRDGSADHISVTKEGVLYLGFLLNTRMARKSRKRSDTLSLFDGGMT